MSDAPSDEQLLDEARRAGDGEMRAFETLVRRYERKVKANCRYISRSPADAEDLAQEVFVKIFFAMERFEGRSTFRTWLQRVKVNHCLNHLKKEQGRTVVDIDDVPSEELSTGPVAERELHRADDREAIGGVLDSMSDTLRVPLVMRDLDKMPYQEIAEILGLGLSAVKMRIKRAREEFRHRFSLLRDSTPSGSAGAP